MCFPIVHQQESFYVKYFKMYNSHVTSCQVTPDEPKAQYETQYLQLTLYLRAFPRYVDLLP